MSLERLDLVGPQRWCCYCGCSVKVVSDSSCLHRTAACQAFLSFTISQSLLKLMSIESVMPSNHLILCRPLLIPPSIFPSIQGFSNESALHSRWPKYWNFSISPSNEYSGLISFVIEWFDFIAYQGALGRPREIWWRGRWEGGLGWGTHVNPWLIHFNVWQNPLQYCKVISLQLKKKKKKEPSLAPHLESIHS